MRWYTTRFNRSFVRFGQIHPYLLHVWFSVGVLVGVLLMVASVVILCLTLYKAFAQDAPEQVLTPVVSYDTFHSNISLCKNCFKNSVFKPTCTTLERRL